MIELELLDFSVSYVLNYGGVYIKNYQKILIFSGVLTLILLNYVLPFLVLGAPTPLYSIDNDNPESHEVTVEVFDSHNKSVFEETYELAPKEHVSQPKPLWLLLRWATSWPIGRDIYWSEGAYKFNVVLDGETEGSIGLFLHPWVSVDIDINSRSPVKIEINSI